MNELLNKISSIENVKGVWIFSKKDPLENINIPLDEDLRKRLIELFQNIINFVENKVKNQEIECIFKYNFFIFKKFNGQWLVVWGKREESTSLIRMEVDIALEESRNKKGSFLKKIKLWK